MIKARGALYIVYMPHVTIRPATEADRPLLRAATIELQDYERSLHDTRRAGEDVADLCLEQDIETLARKSGFSFVAEVDGEAAGYVSFWVEEDDVAGETADSNRFGYIANICVLARFRGQGIAAALLRSAERSFAEQNVSRVRINMLANNDSARRAYAKAGFAPYEVMYEKRIR